MRRIQRAVLSCEGLVSESHRSISRPVILCRSCFLKAASNGNTQPFSTSTKQRDSLDTVGSQVAAYKPANSWEGLEWVGNEEWVEAYIDDGRRIKGFIPRERLRGPQRVLSALRRAVIEVFTAQSHGLPTEALSSVLEGTPDLTQDITFEGSEEGHSVTLKYPSDDIRRRLVASMTGQDNEAAAADAEVGKEPSNPSANTSTSKGQPERRLWLAISLQNDAIKFGIVKRVMQLTGTRIPDPTIYRCASVKDLYKFLSAKPQPRKLAEVLENEEELKQLTNVKVFGSRVTPLDKERQIGRWKVIEQELLSRGLPVPGARVT